MRSPLARWIWRIIALLCLATLLIYVRSVLIPFALAFFLAYLIEPVVAVIQRRGASRSVAILTVFAIAALLTCVLIAVVLPILAQDLQKAAVAIPGYIDQLTTVGDRLARLYHKLNLPLNIRQLVDRLALQLTRQIEQGIGGTIATLLRLLPGSIVLLIVPIIAYYISRDYHRATRRLYQWLKRRARPDLLAKAVAVDRILRDYFRGQALEMLVMTGILATGLTILRVDFALLLGIIAGMLDIIPYFGPLLGAIPALLLALTRSPWHALYVALLFVIANQLQASVLVPRIVGGRVGLHPLLVIFVLLAGGKLFGLLGMVLAVPVVAALKVVVSEYLREIITLKSDLTSSRASGMMETASGKPKQDGSR